MNKRLEPIPRFATEAEERAFWETHDSADYVDWSQAETKVLPTLTSPHTDHNVTINTGQ